MVFDDFWWYLRGFPWLFEASRLFPDPNLGRLELLVVAGQLIGEQLHIVGRCEVVANGKASQDQPID